MHGKLAQKCISLKHPIVSPGLQLQGSSREPGRGRLWGDPGGQGETVGKEGPPRLPASAVGISRPQKGTAGEALGSGRPPPARVKKRETKAQRGSVTTAAWVLASSREGAGPSLLDPFICTHCLVCAGREGPWVSEGRQASRPGGRRCEKEQGGSARRLPAQGVLQQAQAVQPLVGELTRVHEGSRVEVLRAVSPR